MKPIENPDASLWLYKKGGGTEWAPFDVWYWLMSARNLILSGSAEGASTDEFLYVDFHPLLLESGQALVLYKEALWKKKSASTMELVKMNSTQKIPTTWNLQGDKLTIGDFGTGVPVECNGQPALNFKFSRDIAGAGLIGKEIFVFYGSSTFDPMK